MTPALRLPELAPGEEATIAAVHGPEALLKRLIAMGFSTGRPLRVVRRAVLGGPLHVRLGTTDVALRRGEADGISVLRREARPA